MEENNEFEALKDVTPDLIIQDEPEEQPQQEQQKQEKQIPDKDHPIAEIIGEFIDYTNKHVQKLRKEGYDIPEINKNIYDDFLKGFLNKALWHYLPDTGESLEDPKLCAVIGAGGLALITAPTLIGIWNYYNKRKPKQSKQPNQQSQQSEKPNQNVQRNNQQNEENQQPKQPKQVKRKLSAFG